MAPGPAGRLERLRGIPELFHMSGLSISSREVGGASDPGGTGWMLSFQCWLAVYLFTVVVGGLEPGDEPEY